MFTLYFNDENNIFSRENKNKIKLVLKEIAKLEKIKNKYVVEVTIVDDTKIRELNKTYRNIDKVTDVLSFGSLQNVLPNSQILGEIFINHEQLKRQAHDLNQSNERELLFLTTHGVLHLLDYDHMNETDEEIMISKQKKILDNIM